MEDNKKIQGEFSTFLSSIFNGLVMTCFTLRFWYLDYILPILGFGLLFVGLRKLKNENKYFNLCFTFLIIRFILFSIRLIVNATLFIFIYPSFFDYLIIVIDSINLILLILLLLSFKKALLAIQNKSGTDYKVKSINYLIAIYLISSFLPLIFIKYAQVNQQLSHIFLALMAFSGIMVIILFVKLHKEVAPFHTLGEFVTISKNKVSSKFYLIPILSFLLMMVVVAHIYFDSYPMNWSELTLREDNQIKEIKKELLEKGFPAEVLNDISSEDILQCKGALRVVYEVNNQEDVYFADEDKLKMYGIIVELPVEKEEASRYKVFHYFAWSEPKGCNGSECLVGVPSKEKEVTISDFSGRLTYSNASKTFVSPYYGLEKMNYEEQDILHKKGLDYNTMCLGEFSFHEYEEASGYLSYLVEKEDNADYFESTGAYYYQKTFFQYPVVSAKETYLTGTLYENNYNHLYLSVRIENGVAKK